MDAAFELKIRPNKKIIPAALSALRAYAGLYFPEEKQVEKLALALEEAIGNVLFFSGTGALEEIVIRAGTEGACFVTEVLDKGLPGDFDRTLKGEDALGLALMQSCVDSVSIENLGKEGRRQRMIKYLSSMPEAIRSEAQGEDDSPIDTAGMTFTVRPPELEELLEVSRGIYREYGLGYYHDNAYIPELFYESIRSGTVRSIVAVNQDGIFVGHHAFWQWSDLPGVYESGMAVVNKRMRGSGVFNMLLENTHSYYLNTIRRGAYIAYITTFHVFSQKTRLKFGSTPCAFAFNFCPADVCNNVGCDELFHSYAIVCEVPEKTEKTVYLPAEVTETARYIYDLQALPRVIDNVGGNAACENSVVRGSFISRLQVGHITVTAIGPDAAAALEECVFNIRRQGAGMMELFITADSPGCVELYEKAKKLGFFFCGLIPNAEAGDLLYMNRILSGVIDYDTLQTTGPITELLRQIRAFDPDGQTQTKP